MKLGLGLSIPGVATMGGKRVPKHLSLPGSAGSYASTPDSNALDLTSAGEFVARLAMTDWSPSAAQVILAKRNTHSSYQWYVSNAANTVFAFLHSANGSANTIVTDTGGTFVADGAWMWAKMTWTAASELVTWFWAADQPEEPSAWTQIRQAAAPATNLFVSADALEIGSRTGGTALNFNGRISRVLVRNAPDGSLVAEFNPTRDYVSGSTFVSASTGETWTLHGSAAVVAT